LTKGKYIHKTHESCIPDDLIEQYFGPHAKNLHELRILLLQTIHKHQNRDTKLERLLQKKELLQNIELNLADDRVDKIDKSKYELYKEIRPQSRPIGFEPMEIFKREPEPTTPPEILAIISGQDKKSLRKTKYIPLRGGGSASFAKRAAQEANQKMKEEQEKKKKLGWKPVKPARLVKKKEQAPKKKSSNFIVEPAVVASIESDPTAMYALGMDVTDIINPSNIVRMLESKKYEILNHF
jgi:hypothetical protein